MANVPVQGPRRTPRVRFMQLLIEEIEKGYTRESTLKAESWEYICRRMNIEFAGGLELIRIPILKANLLRMKKHYKDFSALLALDGVEWDIGTNKVKAEESVWRAYYKANPNAASYRNQGAKDFDLLCRIFESGVRFD